MTDRGMAHSDGAPACPFVAFEDDRDERSDRPDHRHRCYAEVHPAPRAIAHQEAYCLSSAFAVCPTFQDWAHREAARTRGGAGAPIPPPVATVAASDEPHHHDTSAGRPTDEDVPAPGSEPAAEWQGPRPADPEPGPTPLPPRRNPPRDWAAPPPWAGGPGMSGGAAAAGAAGAAGASAGSPPPESLGDREARGLAGSSADRVAAGESFVPLPPQQQDSEPRRDTWQPSKSPERAQPADAELAGLVGAGSAASAAAAATGPPAAPPPSYADDTSHYRAEATHPPASADGGHGHGHDDAPSWEQPRRYEAYPTIKTRAALPGLPRLGIMAAALGIAALALFFLPSVLDLFGGGGSGGTGSGGESPAPSAALESVAPSPTVPPAPTPQVYVVKSGDTMSKIAKKFDISIDELIAANEDNIKDPDKISIGDQIIIPVPESDRDLEPGAFESPSP
jgi:LysM repeat protein